MEEIDFIVAKDLEPYINCVMVKECDDPESTYHLPLYADGYPGIMFQLSDNGFYLQPRNKRLSELFLYGQTLHPVALEAKGRFKFVVFQLYPFASRYLLGVDPKVLNDDCFDLLQLRHVDMEHYQNALHEAGSLEEKVEIISQLMRALIIHHQVPANDRIQQAISLILNQAGQISMKEVLDQIFLTERTFERNFMAQVGLSPKQFARIVQFQSSLHQLTKSNFDKLVEVGLDSGFADQSHFIRAFKKYTGQTPSYYLRQMTA